MDAPSFLRIRVGETRSTSTARGKGGTGGAVGLPPPRSAATCACFEVGLPPCSDTVLCRCLPVGVRGDIPKYSCGEPSGLKRMGEEIPPDAVVAVDAVRLPFIAEVTEVADELEGTRLCSFTEADEIHGMADPPAPSAAAKRDRDDEDGSEDGAPCVIPSPSVQLPIPGTDNP